MFLAASVNQVMEDIVKKLPKEPDKYKVAFVVTAAETYTGDIWWIRADKEKLEKLGFAVDEFSITGKSKEELEERMEDKNMLVVGGGNTFYLLDQIIKTGFDQMVKRKVEEGMVYIGSSAGAMMVGRRIDLVSEMDERAKAPDLKSDGLGIIDLTLLPHWGDKEMKDDYQKGFETMWVEDVKIIPVSNKQYVWVKESGYEIVQVSN